MSSTKLTYTKAIKGGKLKATDMQVGESVTGTLKGFSEGKYGSNIVLEVQGREVTVFPAGNLKFIEKDVADGKRNIGSFLVITRTDNVTTKNGFTSSQFTISAQDSASKAAPAASTGASVKEKIQAIRNGSN